MNAESRSAPARGPTRWLMLLLAVLACRSHKPDRRPAETRREGTAATPGVAADTDADTSPRTDEPVAPDDENALWLGEMAAFRAEMLMKEGRGAEAEKELLQALKAARKLGVRSLPRAKTLHALGDVYRAQGKLEEAVPPFEKALAIRRAVLPPDDFDLTETLHALARLHVELKRYDDALPLCMLALGIRESCKERYRDNELFELVDQCAGFMEGTGRAKDAQNLRNRMSLLLRTQVDRDKEVADLAYAKEAWDTAEGYYSLCVGSMERMGKADDPETAEYMTGLGKVRIKQGDYVGATNVLMRASVILAKTQQGNEARYVEALGSLGLALLARQETEKATFALEKALAAVKAGYVQEQVSIPPVVGGLARAYHEQGKPEEAETLYRQVLGMQQRTGSPRDLEWARNLDGYAKLLRETGRAEESAGLAEQAERIRRMDAKLRAAEKATRKEESKASSEDYYDEKIREANRGLQEDPDNAYEYLRDRAYGYKKKGMYDEALADYARAIELDPKNHEAYDSRASTHWDMGEYEKAVADTTKVIELDRSSYFHNYFRRGSMYYDMGAFDPAIRDFDTAIGDHSTYASSYRRRGLCYQRKGDYGRALADFNKSIEIEPDGSSVYRDRAALYAETGKLDLALSDYDTFAEHPCCSRHQYGPRARFYLYYVRDYAKAAKDFRSWLKTTPSDASGALWLHFALCMGGQDGVAELTGLAGDLDKEKWPYPAVRLYLGEVPPEEFLGAVGGETKKEKLERRCEALFFVGKYWALRGEKHKAREHFEKCIATGLHYHVEYRAAKLELKLLEEDTFPAAASQRRAAPEAQKPARDAGQPRQPSPAADTPKEPSKETRQKVQELIRILKSRDDVDKQGALFALEDLGPAAAIAVPTLRKTLKDEDGFVREYSIDALGAIGPPAREAVPDLIKALWTVDELTRDKVIAALLKIDPGKRSATAGLLERLKIEDSLGREDVLKEYRRLGGNIRDAVPILVKRMRTVDEFGRAEIAGQLGEFGADATLAIPELKRASKDKDEDVRAAAAEALEKIRAARKGISDPMDW